MFSQVSCSGVEQAQERRHCLHAEVGHDHRQLGVDDGLEVQNQNNFTLKITF